MSRYLSSPSWQEKVWCTGGCGGEHLCVCCKTTMLSKSRRMCRTCAPIASKQARIRKAQMAAILGDWTKKATFPCSTSGTRRIQLLIPYSASAIAPTSFTSGQRTCFCWSMTNKHTQIETSDVSSCIWLKPPWGRAGSGEASRLSAGPLPPAAGGARLIAGLLHLADKPTVTDMVIEVTM